MFFGFAPYRVEGKSMIPSLRDGDYLLAREHAEGKPSPLSRGNIVVVAVGGKSRLKRVVGLPGERITFTDGMLLVNGDKLTEPYLRGLPPYLGLEHSEFVLDGEEYFVMGDNRAHSTDSRDYGPVRRAQIEGRAVCRIWPPRRWGMP